MFVGIGGGGEASDGYSTSPPRVSEDADASERAGKGVKEDEEEEKEKEKRWNRNPFMVVGDSSIKTAFHAVVDSQLYSGASVFASDLMLFIPADQRDRPSVRRSVCGFHSVARLAISGPQCIVPLYLN